MGLVMNLEDNFMSVLKEALEEGLFEIITILDTNRKENLTDILMDLRAICGITIVTVLEPAVRISETTERTILKIKFKPGNKPLKAYMLNLRDHVLKFKEVEDFRIKKLVDIFQQKNRKKAKKDILKR